MQECFETDDPFDTAAYNGIEHGRCKLTLIKTLTRPIAGLEDQAWKIALPRLLDKGIVAELFTPKNARVLQHNFTIAGVFRPGRKSFSLHEEIRDLLLAYARSKGWLDAEETRDLHGRLWDHINQRHNQQYNGKLEEFLMAQEWIGSENTQKQSAQHLELEQIFPRIWMLEACYHRCLSGVWLDNEGVQPCVFADALMGSATIQPVEKWKIAFRLPKLSHQQISTWMKFFREEAEQWRGFFGSVETAMLLSDITKGKLSNISTDISYWEQQVEQHGLAGQYAGLVLALNGSKCHAERQIEVVDEMLQCYGDSTVPGVQETCATALANSAELLLTLDQHEAAIYRIQQVLTQVSESDQKFAIMRFLLWLAGAEITIADILAAIRALLPEVEFSWGFDELRPLIEGFSDPRKTQAKCLIAFFEQDHNIKILETCLARNERLGTPH